jgi:hypothetical protein
MVDQIQTILEHPELLVFVDKTGCNTSQIIDGHVGRQLYILPKDGTRGCLFDLVSDMHFIFLPFIAGTGETIMCAVILKSKKPFEEIPLSWRYGIDLIKPLTDEKSSDNDYSKYWYWIRYGRWTDLQISGKTNTMFCMHFTKSKYK